jgi:hypothetical protein
MHTIEPYFKWRDYYIAAEDKLSPFYKRQYSEFEFSQKMYNYYIHPQWDSFGSETLYLKLLYVNYKQGFAVIELLGEWNDCINNDIMLLKRKVIDPLIKHNIGKFILIGENILNFHASDDCYYQEWLEDASELDGWVVALQLRPHVLDEMQQAGITHYLHSGTRYNDLQWRQYRPQHLLQVLEQLLFEKLLH